MFPPSSLIEVVVQHKRYTEVGFQDLLHTIDSIAFKKMDERLANYLQTKFRQLQTSVLHTTHQEIAGELGTSREVISRLLKQLEKRGVVTMSRNQIGLRSPSLKGYE